MKIFYLDFETVPIFGSRIGQYGAQNTLLIN